MSSEASAGSLGTARKLRASSYDGTCVGMTMTQMQMHTTIAHVWAWRNEPSLLTYLPSTREQRHPRIRRELRPPPAQAE